MCEAGPTWRVGGRRGEKRGGCRSLARAQCPCGWRTGGRAGTGHLESLGELLEAGPSVLRGRRAQEGVHTALWPELTASRRTFAPAAATVPPTAQVQLFCPLVPVRSDVRQAGHHSIQAGVEPPSPRPTAGGEPVVGRRRGPSLVGTGTWGLEEPGSWGAECRVQEGLRRHGPALLAAHSLVRKPPLPLSLFTWGSSPAPALHLGLGFSSCGSDPRKDFQQRLYRVVSTQEAAAVRLMLQARDLTPEGWPGPALPGWWGERCQRGTLRVTPVSADCDRRAAGTGAIVD